MLIFMGILQFGFLLSGQIGLINSVREAARYGSTSPTTDAGSAASHGAAICNQLKTNLASSIAGYKASNLVLVGATKVNYTSYQDPHDAPLTYSVRLTVTVVYKHLLFIPLVGNIIDGIDGANDQALRLDAKEQMRVENPLLTTDPGLGTTVNCT
jgi:hypothetical protein